MADSVEVGNFWYLEYFSIPLLLDYVINSSVTTYAEFINTVQLIARGAFQRRSPLYMI